MAQGNGAHGRTGGGHSHAREEAVPVLKFRGKLPSVERQLKKLDVDVHRRILDCVNSARRHEDLGEIEACGVDHELCKKILAARDAQGAYGFRSMEEMRQARILNTDLVARLIAWFGPARYGQWTIHGHTLYPGGGGYPVAHAAVLHTGKVLFLPEDETQTIVTWNPANDTIGYTTNSPSDYLFCSGHCFLSDGQLLVAGGGGLMPSSNNRGWRFDPGNETWYRTANDMPNGRWYPTVLHTGWSRKILVVGGSPSVSTTDVYDERSDTFEPMQGESSTRGFPQLYPGLHLLPDGEIFYSRTGWGGSTPSSYDGADSTGRNAYLRFTAPNQGKWVELDSTMEHAGRNRGMSVLLLRTLMPSVRVMVIGGTQAPGNNTAEIMALSTLNPGWRHPSEIPGADSRINVNAVLLPDGTVFVVGGTNDPAKPCALYNPATARWRTMARANYVKRYHSVAVLLPSGEVLATGGSNFGGGSSALEVFTPPYLFDAYGRPATRPTIGNAPIEIEPEVEFRVTSASAADIRKIVLVRPMAVTHQTDTEQRVIELDFRLDGGRLYAHMADFHDAPSIAPPGFYMLFVINTKGVPSVARWIKLK